MSVLLGVPGQIAKLDNKLTDARAQNLDNLTTNVATLAPASTALSTTNWPGTRQELLDLIARVSGAVPKTLQVGACYEPAIDVLVQLANYAHGVSVVDSTTGAGAGNGTQWETLISLAATAGTIGLLTIGSEGGSNPPAFDWRVTLDGSVAFDQSLLIGRTPSDTSGGYSLVGTIIFVPVAPYTVTGIAFEDIRFTTSCLVEVRRNDINNRLRLAYKYHILK